MASLADHRRAKDAWLKSAPESPLAGAPDFDGLSYYPADPTLAFTVSAEAADGAPLTIQTSDGRERTYTRDFTVALVVEGTPITLTLYGTPHGLFLPFRDRTSGAETYGGGRYLDVAAPDAAGAVEIDFNLAYHPYCAYDARYSCPIPPAENWLEVAIRAGERSPD